VADGHQLVRFLFDRWNDDQSKASYATKFASPVWHLGDDDETVLWWRPLPDLAAHERAEGRETTADQWTGQHIDNDGVHIAPHIAQWHPQRVLAEYKARSTLVHAYEAALGRASTPEEVRRMLEWSLLVLASPYAEHPDFRPGWKLPAA
jgi:hypothetical protein